MRKIKISKNLLIYITLLVYFAFSVFLISKHETWRDEAQAFVIAKNLNIVDIFKILRVEGHPILWFVVLKPFALLKIPFQYLSYYSLLLMLICAYIFLQKSPFPFWIKIIAMCGLTFTYYNPVIARVYCLVALIIMLVMAYYGERDKNTLIYMMLIGLLMQTHIKVYGFAFGLCLDFFVEYRSKNKEKLKYLFIPFVSTVLVFLELLPYGSYKPFMEVSIDRFTIDLLDSLTKEIYRTFSICFGIENYITVRTISGSFLILLLIVFYLVIRKNKLRDYLGIILCALCGFGAYFVINIFVYSTYHTTMATILSDLIIAIAWMIEAKEDHDIKKVFRIILVMCCLLNIKIEFADITTDIDKDFSCSKKTAEYITKNIENDSVILVEYNYLNPPVYSYVTSDRTDIGFYDLSNKRWYLFHQWSQEHDKVSYTEIAIIANFNFKNRHVYYMTHEIVDDDRFELIYSNLGEYSVTEEHYCIYKVR